MNIGKRGEAENIEGHSNGVDYMGRETYPLQTNAIAPSPIKDVSRIEILSKIGGASIVNTPDVKRVRDTFAGADMYFPLKEG